MYQILMIANFSWFLIFSTHGQGEDLVIYDRLMYVIFLDFSFPDGFPSVGNAIGNISSGRLLQYESSTCFMDGKCKNEEYHEGYLKTDGGKMSKDEPKETDRLSHIKSQGNELSRFGKVDEMGNRKKKLLGHPYGSFKGLKEYRHNSEEKTLRPGLSRMIPSVSFNEKILTSGLAPQSQRKKSAVFRLSFKRRSYDAEDKLEDCK